jgi:hypothetical protein
LAAVAEHHERYDIDVVIAGVDDADAPALGAFTRLA